jgi:hypothetical protein
MQEGFLESVFSLPSHKVAGSTLFPFSLAHWTALDVSKNPFVYGGKPSVYDALEFICICSTDPADLLAGKVAKCRWLRFKLRWIGHNWADIVNRITNYIKDYGSGPEYWVPSGKGKSLRSPWVARVVYILCGKYNMSHKEAWATPFGLAMWYEAVCGEIEQASNSEIMTEDDMAIAELIKGLEDQDGQG